METMNNRFRQLRLACKKSQEEFGKILGLTKSGVSDIERGKRNVTSQHLIMLSNWHERKVNIEWLRTGEGGPDNMFLPQEDDDLVAQAKALLGENDPLFESLVITYSKLSASNRKNLIEFFKDFLDTFAEKTNEKSIQPEASEIDIEENPDLKSQPPLSPEDINALKFGRAANQQGKKKA